MMKIRVDCEILLRGLLTVGLGAAALAKIVSEPDPDGLLPAAVVRAAASVDILIAILISTGRGVPVGACLLIAVSMTGAILALMFPDKSCGCAGSWLRLLGSAHVMFSALFGLAAAALLWSAQNERRPRTGAA
jgi:hypothetical protein